MKNPTVITITNRKGGVGKTATVVNTGAGLAINGHKVLLIDLDPSQANLTMSLIGRIPNDGPGIIRGLLDDTVTIEDITYETPTTNLYIIPSEKTIDGKDADVEMALKDEIGRENFLKDLLDCDFIKTFDYVLIDNGPKLGLLTINSLNASDFFIVPTNTDILSLSGLADTLKVTEKVKKLNPKLKNLGFLMTKVDKRLKNTKDAREFLNSQFSEQIFESSISTNAKFLSLPENQKTIFDVENKSGKGHKDFMNFVGELTTRVETSMDGEV